MDSNQQHYQFVSAPKTKTAKHTVPVCFFQPNDPLRTGAAYVVPNMALFIRDVTEYGNIGAVKHRLQSLSPWQMIRLAWWNKFSLFQLAKKDFATGLLLLVQIEALKTAAAKPTLYMLSDQVTDLAVALQNTRILQSFHNFITKQMKVDDCVMTNNFPTLLTTLAEIKISPTAIAVPFSVEGYQMNPNKTACEQALALMPVDRVIAIVPTNSPKEQRYLAKLGITKSLQDWF